MPLTRIVPGEPYVSAGAEPDLYKEMADLCARSLAKNLQGMDQLLVLHTANETWVSVSKKLFDVIQALNVAGHAVLRLDADMLLCKTMPFPSDTQMRLYVLAGSWFPSVGGNSEIPDTHYLNGGLVYYPPHMSPSLWALGRSLWETFKDWHERHDVEQYINNRMYYAQDPPEQGGLDHEIHSYPSQLASDAIPHPSPYFLHALGTRGQRQALNVLKEKAREIGL
jgi:hypothetical protein